MPVSRKFFFLSRFLNAVLLVGLTGAIVWTAVKQACYNQPHGQYGNHSVNVDHVLRHIHGLNVLTNLLLAVPGLMLAVMGFPLEGCIVILTALFSCLWHASGWQIFGVCDQFFASLTLVTMMLIFLRICQARGYPEFTCFFLVLPAVGLLMFSTGDSAHIANDGSVVRNDETCFVAGRMSHSLWHVLSAATFFVLALELLRTPDLLPNRPLASAVQTRDYQMKLRTWRTRGNKGLGPSSTVFGGLLQDLFSIQSKPIVSSDRRMQSLSKKTP